jgi:hypothetical protein
VAEVEFVGPFERHEVVVNGHKVPYLAATPTRDGVHLTLDCRFGLDLTSAQALEVVPFLADVVAIALGYTCFPCEEVPNPPRLKPWPHLHGLGDTIVEES